MSVANTLLPECLPLLPSILTTNVPLLQSLLQLPFLTAIEQRVDQVYRGPATGFHGVTPNYEGGQGLECGRGGEELSVGERAQVILTQLANLVSEREGDEGLLVIDDALCLHIDIEVADDIGAEVAARPRLALHYEGNMRILQIIEEIKIKKRCNFSCPKVGVAY